MNKNFAIAVLGIAILFFAMKGNATTKEKAKVEIIKKPEEVKAVEKSFAKKPKGLKAKLKAIKEFLKKSPHPFTPKELFLLIKHPKYIPPLVLAIGKISASGGVSPLAWAEVFRIQRKLNQA
jgi:hypothetical protein